MRLTRKKAIEITKELWTWLAETGEGYKNTWPGWKTYGVVQNDCAFCEYSYPKAIGYHDTDDVICRKCPWYRKFGHCEEYDSPYWKWWEARSAKTRKKYARLFLEKLEEL